MIRIADSLDFKMFIDAAETEDEIGVVLRMHLAIESLLDRFLGLRITSALAPYIKLPEYSAQKVALAAAFGMPIPFLAAAKEVNRIRNDIAHGRDALTQKKLDQLAEKVDSIQSIHPSFAPLSKRYVEIPRVHPGKKFSFGESNLRIDFLIATSALVGELVQWLSFQQHRAVFDRA